MIKFVSNLGQIDDFFPGTPFSSTNNADGHDIAEVIVKVVLNTINQTKTILVILFSPFRFLLTMNLPNEGFPRDALHCMSYKLVIYVFIKITGSIYLLVEY